jgi:antibiotic biosynthesis monooxygenase (ABM) superfamily enzyme
MALRFEDEYLPQMHKRDLFVTLDPRLYKTKIVQMYDPKEAAGLADNGPHFLLKMEPSIPSSGLKLHGDWHNISPCGVCLLPTLGVASFPHAMEETLTNEMNRSGTIEQGATVVITHRVRDGQQARYDDWANEIHSVSRSAEGFLDWQIIRPVAGLTATYTVILRFDTPEHLQHWMNSPARARLIDKARPLLAKDDEFFVRSGLDFWFTPEGAKAKVPVRWKQFLVTWSAIYPLSLGISLAVTPLLHDLGLLQNRYIVALCTTGLVVALMVYLVMPRYTRLLQRWLYD